MNHFAAKSSFWWIIIIYNTLYIHTISYARLSCKSLYYECADPKSKEVVALFYADSIHAAKTSS